MSAAQPRTRVRAVQQRAEETRARLLEAAIELFSTRGYDGASIRDIETAAGVKRGLVAYHFGTKPELWKAAVEKVFEPFHWGDGASGAGASRDEALRSAIRDFVLFSARHPELNRLMVQEGKSTGWRLEFLVERFVRPRVDWIARVVGRPVDPHELYLLVGAATFVFNVEHECHALFGVNPRDPAFANAHADRVADLLLGSSSAFRVED